MKRSSFSFLLSILLWGLSLPAFSQELAISFLPTFNGSPLTNNDEEILYQEGTFQIETLKFYVSQVELWDDDQLVFKEDNRYHLLNAAIPQTLNFQLNLPHQISFTKIRFQVGIDSLTNVSGAFGGDLDPTNGMYWTWQSGYINFKLEGRAENCPARHQRFQYHIGGYQYPYNTIQSVTLEVSDHRSIQIKVALEQLFESIDVEKNYQIMSPGENAVLFSQLFKHLFSTTP